MKLCSVAQAPDKRWTEGYRLTSAIADNFCMKRYEGPVNARDAMI